MILMGFVKVLVVAIFASTLMLSFQNCGSKFNSLSELDSASELDSVCVQQPNSAQCLSAKAFSLSVNNSTLIEIKAAVNYPFFVATTTQQQIAPQLSSIKAVSGSCKANTTWAPLQKTISPWTYTANSQTKNIAAGMNNMTFTAESVADMAGCAWQACIQSTAGSKSCMTLTFNSGSNGGGGTGGNSCVPATAPANQTSTKVCTNNASLSYTETTTYSCNTTTKQWIPTTTNNSQTKCVSSSQTCQGSPPTPTTATLACSSKFGSTYTGSYTETTSKACNPTNLTWSVETKSDNAASVCTTRTCAPPMPNPQTATYQCSTLGEGFSGTYTETTSYNCDNSSLLWTPSTSNTKDSCVNSYTKLSSLQVNAGVLEVPAGVTAYIDRNIDVAQLKINGTLKCLVPTKMNILAETIFVNGVFECGTAAKPFTGDLTISLKRNASIMPKTGRELNGNTYSAAAQSALNANAAVAVNFRALLITGKLYMHGVVKTKMTRLTQTINAGATSIQVESTVNWKAGDQIAIASTSFNPAEAEEFTISQINGNLIQLDRAVSYQHWGGAVENFTHSTGRSFTLDQRAEVVNLTRNLKIEAYDRLSDGTEANQLNPEQETSEPGGHVMAHQGGAAYISSVEFYKMGQAGIMARYPFHWHRSGDVNGQYITNSSIHKSFQRCVTVHATHNSTVENNVCYDFRGHGYFLEDGIETGNVIRGNIGFGGKLPHASKVLLSSDDRNFTTDLRFPATATFWISHPQNTVTNNIAAGSMGTGFWNVFETNSVNLATTAFNNNIAHTTLVGHTWDGAPGTESSNNPNNYADKKLVNAHYKPPTAQTFSRLTAYKNSQTGLYFRGNTVVFNEALMADNGWSFFMAYNQIVRNSVIVGQSQYVASGKPKHAGVILYDGPFELESVDFNNFHLQPTTPVTLSSQMDYVPFYVIGGSEKFVNSTKGLRFTPDVRYKYLLEPVNDPWKDKIVTQAIRDQDGTLTGTAGGLVMPKNDISSDATCTIKTDFIGAKICPQSTTVGIFMLASGQYGGAQGVQLPFVIHRNGNIASITDADVNEIRSGTGAFFNAKFASIIKPEYNYDITFSDDFSARNKVNDVWIRFYTEKTQGMSQVLKIKNYGSNCSLTNGTRVNSMAELNAANFTAYYSNQSSFFIRMKADTMHPIITTGEGQMSPYTSVAFFNCTGAYSAASDNVNFDGSGGGSGGSSGQAIGIVGGVSTDGYVSGWACMTGQANPIGLHIYAGNSAGAGGTMVGAGTANISSEPAVGVACNDPTNSPHRFNIKITTQGFEGKKVYVHAIDNANNPTIDGSGNYSIPGGPPPPASGTIKGYIDGVQADGTIVGWACLVGKSQAIELHVYAGGAAGRDGTMVYSGYANISSEAGVGAACSDPTNSPHRFAFKFSNPSIVGKTIFIHGINNADNSLIDNSGNYTFK